MANWTKTKIYFDADREKFEKLFVEGDECKFSLARIVPMPPSLDMESGGRTDLAIDAYLSSINPNNKAIHGEKVTEEEYQSILHRKKLVTSGFFSYFKTPPEGNMTVYSREDEKIYGPFEEIVKQGKQYVDNILQYGAPTWYEWCRKNWGTKWDAYDVSYYDGVLTFSTANGFAGPVLEKLALDYEISFEGTFADEDIGAGTGRFFSDGTSYDEEFFKNFSKEAYETAFELWGCDDEYRYDEEKGTYVYIEEE